MLYAAWLATVALALGAWSAASLALTAAYVGARWVALRRSGRQKLPIDIVA